MKTDRGVKRNQRWASIGKLALANAGVLLWCLLATPCTAQSYKILHTFGTNVMGQYPYSTLVQGADGALYGTTDGGGSANLGQVFKVNPDGNGYTVPKDFNGSDGAYPDTTLVLSGSTLYGTTYGGGSTDSGTVFKLNTDGSGFAVLHDFAGYPTDGACSFGSLMLSGTTLYGTTYEGGGHNEGTIFKLQTDGSGFELVKEFTVEEGANPEAGLVLSGAISTRRRCLETLNPLTHRIRRGGHAVKL